MNSELPVGFELIAEEENQPIGDLPIGFEIIEDDAVTEPAPQELTNEIAEPQDDFIQASPMPEQRQQPTNVGYGASSGIPIQQQQQVDGYTGADTKQPYKSMGELVSEKMTAIGEGVVRAGQNVIPQFKSQLGGLMQTLETPLLTPTEFYSNNQQAKIRDLTMSFDTYEDYTAAHEQSKGVGSWIAEKGRELRAQAKGEMKPSTAERGSTEYYIEQGLGSILNMVPMLAVSIAGKRPDIGLGIMLAQVEGDAYGEGRDKGLDQQSAKAYASFQAIAEVIPSAIPLSKVMSGSGVLTQGLTEGAQELVTAALQSGIDKGYINPEMTWGEAVENMKDAAIIGAGSGSTIALATKPFAPKQDSYEDDPLKMIAVEMEREAANKNIREIASKAFDEQTANIIVQDQTDKQELPNELEAKEQPKPPQIKPEQAQTQITQEPIDQEAMPTQDPVEVELPKEEAPMIAKPLAKGKERLAAIPNDGSDKSTSSQLSEVVRGRKNLDRIKEKRGLTQGEKDFSAELDAIEKSAIDSGYEIHADTAIGKRYDHRQNVDVLNFENDDSMYDDEMVVDSVNKPSIMKDGKLVQRGSINVRQGTKTRPESEKPEKRKVTGLEVVEAPISEITISQDVPQFKEGADIKGVVEPLGGKFERTGVAPIQIWVRENGAKEVISGRHRLDLAERSGEKTIPAQYHYESEGFSTDQAAALDAVLNIREGQGKVKDYVDFIQATKPRESEAEAQGILARQTGKRAFTIATKGSDALITSHRNDQVTDEGATRIADAAPKDEALQAVGIKAIQEGKTIAVAENLVKAVKSMQDETQQASGDMFGFDDSAMIEAEELAKAAVKKQNEIQKTLSAVKGAAKRPELAAKEGVDVKDPAAVKERIKQLEAEKREWQNWHTNPKLTAELKGKPQHSAPKEEVTQEPTPTEDNQGPDMFAEPEVKPITKVIDEQNKKTGQGLTDADKISKPKVDYSDNAIEAHKAFKETLSSGTATKESVQESFNNLVAAQESIMAQLNKRSVTKEMLMGIAGGYVDSQAKKADLIVSVYESMLAAHVMKDMISTSYGTRTYLDQISEMVESQSQDDVNKHIETIQKRAKAHEAAFEGLKKALTNPETHEEFKEFIRFKGKEKLTPEQLAAYDEIVSASMKVAPKEKVEAPKVDGLTITRHETTHAKKNIPLFIVSVSERVSKEQYSELLGKAKELGGWYSSYKRNGAIPGWQFKSKVDADNFEQLLKGKDIDKSDNKEAKAAVVQTRNADKLSVMADKLEKTALEAINQKRQTNTAKRASEASRAIESAEKKLALAGTIRQIAGRMAKGEMVHLGQLSQGTQLEELISLQKQAIPNDLYENGSFDGYSISRPLKEGVTVEDYIANVKFPKIEVYTSNMKRVSEKIAGKKGFMRISKEILKLPSSRRNDWVELSVSQYKKLKDAEKIGFIDSYDIGGFADDRYKTIGRIERLGITTVEQLRAAIRELDSLTVAPKEEDKAAKIEREIVNKKIPGFFPTPKTLVEQMIDYANIEAGMTVLEPSAGKGNIADEILSTEPDADLKVIEFNSGLHDLLKAKGFNVVDYDFLEHTGQYDRIIMNPPFENFQDVDHVKHAYEQLKPGGRVVAIMGASVKNSRKKAVEFRGWLDDMGSVIEDLPDGSFKTAERKTGVSTVMVVIDKPEANVSKLKSEEARSNTLNAAGSNHVPGYNQSGVPDRRETVVIDGRTIKIPEGIVHFEPVKRTAINIMGRRLYHGRIKGKFKTGEYSTGTGEVRVKSMLDIETLAHEMAHYLDFYSKATLPDFKRAYKRKTFSDEVMSLSYTDENTRLQQIEGFAEFVRLWVTNSEQAKAHAPKFYKEFDRLLKQDPDLAKNMKKFRRQAHQYYYQGAFSMGEGKIGNNRTLGMRFDDWAHRRAALTRQQVIDKFHAGFLIDKETTGKVGSVEESAYKMLRTANSAGESMTDYVMNFGTIRMDKNGEVRHGGTGLFEIFNKANEITLKDEHAPGLTTPAGSKKLDLFLKYMVGRRALELHTQGRENLITKQEAKSFARLGKDYPIFEQMHNEYQEFNERMLDFYVDTGLISKDAKSKFREMNKDYVPFFRIRDKLSGGTGSSSTIKRLKGGMAPLNDILDNIQDGISANIRAGLANRAKQVMYSKLKQDENGALFAAKIGPDSKLIKVHEDALAEKIRKVLEDSGVILEEGTVLDTSDPSLLNFWQHGIPPTPHPETGLFVDSYMVNGKPEYFEVIDPVLTDMLQNLNPGSYNQLMNAAFTVKNLFTRSITLGIEFMGANIVRDTMSAFALTKNPVINLSGDGPILNYKGYWPLLSNLQGFHAYFSKNKLYQEYLLGGGGYSARSQALTKQDESAVRSGLKTYGVKDAPGIAFTTIDYLAGAFEYSTRIAEFAASRRAGKTLLEAGYDAREISTDYQVTGSSKFIAGGIRTAAFLNAAVQSIDRTWREVSRSRRKGGNPVGLAMRGFMGITVLSMLNAAMNDDDEDFQDIPFALRATNWFVRISEDEFIRIPKPYDVGMIFGTMPEIFYQYMKDQDGRKATDHMIWALTQIFGLDGTPAFATGILEAKANKTWTGSPIVPQAMQGMSDPKQFSVSTKETFVELGKKLNVSPMKAQHMFEAYTGYLGGYLTTMTDKALWNKEEFGEQPGKRWYENPVTTRFMYNVNRPSTESLARFFKLKDDIKRVTSDFASDIGVNNIIMSRTGEAGFKDDRGFIDALKISAEEKKVLYGLSSAYNEVSSVVYGPMRTQELAIARDKTLTATQKRDKLEAAWKRKTEVFKQLNSRAEALLKVAKEKAKARKQEK